ncbi:hypothetical protein EGT74_12365 [Chitinophaga lutea]|uniref:DUF6630 domain-containing protein n=1 Tax=Chitinophaga lutea TaxID=2488634 RepID=A0A3N4QE57_9BACT|nr:hypothetical protein [Chitinophaga lutea]RPE14257.1 hypothetical protein EGT74_12365 [Chitinophaga lutea]
MYKPLEKLMSPQEITALPKTASDADLLDHLLKEKIVLVVDWSGEEENSRIADFLRHRLQQFGSKAIVDAEGAYAQLEKKQPERGDAVPLLLQYFQKGLKKEGFVICQLDRQNDAYYILLAPDKVAKELKKAKDAYWNVAPFGQKTGEVLYTINCTCGSMNVWQLRRSEPAPADDYCENCGKMLFDKDGNALLTVEKDYI